MKKKRKEAFSGIDLYYCNFTFVIYDEFNCESCFFFPVIVCLWYFRVCPVQNVSKYFSKFNAMKKKKILGGALTSLYFLSIQHSFYVE